MQSAKNKMAFQKSSGPLQYTGTVQTIKAIAKSVCVSECESGGLGMWWTGAVVGWGTGGLG